MLATDRIHRQFTFQYHRMFRPTYNSPQINQYHRKDIDLQTTGSRLCTTTDHHQYQHQQQSLLGKCRQPHTGKTGGTRTGRIEEGMHPFIYDGHSGKSMVPFENDNHHRSHQQQQDSHDKYDFGVQVIQMYFLGEMA